MRINNPFHKSSQWERKRLVILRRDEYMCRECKRYGRTTEANTVHHIHPIETHWEYRLLNINLLSLCESCHNSMHNRFDDELTDRGKAWVGKIKNSIPPLAGSVDMDSGTDEGSPFQ